MKALKNIVFSLFGATLFAAAAVFLAGNYSASQEKAEEEKVQAACAEWGAQMAVHYMANGAFPDPALAGFADKAFREYLQLVSFGRRQHLTPNDAHIAAFNWCMRTSLTHDITAR